MDEPLKDSKKIFLISESLDGHRFSWLEQILTIEDLKKLNVIVLTLSSLKQTRLSSVNSVKFNSKEALKSFLQRESQSGNKFIFLEADKWLNFIRKSKFYGCGIILRPYISGYTLKAVMSYLTKLALINIINRRDYFQIRCIKMPFYKPRYFNMGRNWIADSIPFHKAIEYFKDESSIRVQPEKSLLILGFQDRRKGINFAVRAMEIIKYRDDNLTLKVVGSMTVETQNRLLSLDSNFLHLQSGYLPERDYYNQIRSSVCVLALNINRASSGVLIETLVLGKPLILRRYSLTRHFDSMPEFQVYTTKLRMRKLAYTILKASNDVQAVGLGSSQELRHKVLADEFKYGVCEFLVDNL